MKLGGGAMVLAKLPVPGVLLIWIIVGQGPIALAVSAGFFSHLSVVFFFLPLSGSAARYELKRCLKGPLNPKQPTNQATKIKFCFLSQIVNRGS